MLAPTGTIGFMMDCDTTGIEPDFSLVKFKKLVGGGSMQIVNQTIPRALRKMGYQTERSRRSSSTSPSTATSSTPRVSRPSTTRSSTPRWAPARSAPMGHVRMMAACQPFLSGAISKTVNLPETATVEEIEDIYLQSWKLGLKATAIYRDNCKVGQPLSSGKGDNTGTADDGSKGAAEAKVEKVIEYRPTRKRLPKSRARRGPRRSPWAAPRAT